MSYHIISYNSTSKKGTGSQNLSAQLDTSRIGSLLDRGCLRSLTYFPFWSSPILDSSSEKQVWTSLKKNRNCWNPLEPAYWSASTQNRAPYLLQCHLGMDLALSIPHCKKGEWMDNIYICMLCIIICTYISIAVSVAYPTFWYFMCIYWLFHIYMYCIYIYIFNKSCKKRETYATWIKVEYLINQTIT